MPNKLIKDLIDKGAVILKEQGYSIRSSEYTLLTWKQFQEFCTKRGYETYLPSHKDEFIAELGKFTPPLFMNRDGQKLTRAGITYILNKYAKAASAIDPSIPEKIPPHLMRHTKAMHVYEADNDLVHVRDFLGHSDIKTTDIYARSSLTMKKKALERVSDSPVPSLPSWQKSQSTMEWLKSFGTQKT